MIDQKLLRTWEASFPTIHMPWYPSPWSSTKYFWADSSYKQAWDSRYNQPPKNEQAPSWRMVCFYHFTSNFASRHSSRHFLNSSTSKSAPTKYCFDHICPSKIFEACFAQQQRALFRHFQQCSDVEVFFSRFDFNMYFAPQGLAMFCLSSNQMAPL